MTTPATGDRLDRWRAAGIFLLYLAITLVYFGRGLHGHFGDDYIGRETDPPQAMWFFNWWRFSLSHGLNPFFTDWVWAPLGNQPGVDDLRPAPLFDLDPSASNGGRARHLQHHRDVDAAARGIHGVSAMPTRDGRVLAVVLGGYLFGFSPYMLGQMLGTSGLHRVFSGAADRAHYSETPRRRDLGDMVRADAGGAAHRSIFVLS